MKSKITVGDWVILNEYDRPCPKLSAQVVEMRLMNGHAYADCVYRDLDDDKEVFKNMPVDRMTLLEDFGVDIHGNRVGPSIATYPDGRPRKWQS